MKRRKNKFNTPAEEKRNKRHNNPPTVRGNMKFAGIDINVLDEDLADESKGSRPSWKAPGENADAPDKNIILDNVDVSMIQGPGPTLDDISRPTAIENFELEDKTDMDKSRSRTGSIPMLSLTGVSNFGNPKGKKK